MHIFAVHIVPYFIFVGEKCLTWSCTYVHTMYMCKVKYTHKHTHKYASYSVPVRYKSEQSCLPLLLHLLNSLFK